MVILTEMVSELLQFDSTNVMVWVPEVVNE